MKIFQIHLKCFDLSHMKEFYTNVLEMSLVNESEEHFTVMAGTTKLIFEKDDTTPFYHVCFRTDVEFYEYMYRKLGEESVLLANEDGEYSMFWEGKQAYFTDPDGNILEILERPCIHSDNHRMGWFDVGEIGLPTQNVPEMKSKLEKVVPTQYVSESETFSFYGNQEGVFVLVKERRPWYPTERGATIHPIRVVVSGDQVASFKDEEYPYEVIVRKEWEEAFPAVQFRMARPTNQIDQLTRFYVDGLGLKKIGEFKDHEGYDGVMIGLPNHGYHLEFTQTKELVEWPQPTKEHLLVFYMPNRYKIDQVVDQLKWMGYNEVEPENPYWGRGGITIEDPDGYRIVLMNSVGI